MRFDPRTKIAWVLVLTTLAIVFRDLAELAALFAVTVLLAVVFRVEIRTVLRRGKRFFQLIVLVAMIQLVFVRGGHALVSIGDFALVTSEGVMTAAQVVLRYAVIVLAGFIMGTSSSRESIQGLIQLKLPYIFVFMVVIAIRFIPALNEAFQDVMTAIQLRGVDIKHIPVKKKLTMYGSVLVPVVGDAIISAQDLAITMEARGFGAYRYRTSYRKLSLTGYDKALLLVWAAAVIALVVLAVMF